MAGLFQITITVQHIFFVFPLTQIALPKKVRELNGTLYLAVFSIPLEKDSKSGSVDVKSNWQELMRHPKMTYSLAPLTAYHIPEAETFNLLGDNGGKAQCLKTHA